MCVCLDHWDSGVAMTSVISHSILLELVKTITYARQVWTGMQEKSSPSFLSSRGGGAFNTRNVEFVRELGDEAIGSNISSSFMDFTHIKSIIFNPLALLDPM
jgi:hypothetical protein